MTDIPDGHGQEGVFLGLPDTLTNLQTAQICVIPVPFELTTSYQQGTALGPAAMIEASRYVEVYDNETDSTVCQLGIHTTAPVKVGSSEEMLSDLKAKVKEHALNGKFVVTLGGEHSISQAPIDAMQEIEGGITVLQLDAHTDLREAYQGNPLSHASVMARVQDMPGVTNIVAVGIRAMDQSEWERGKREDIFFDHIIQDDPDWIEKVISRLSQRVYLSFDLDVFGCELMPSTGTPEPGGLNWFQACKLLKRVCQERALIGCDIVELMPNQNNPAPDFLAAKLAYKIMSYRFHGEQS